MADEIKKDPYEDYLDALRELRSVVHALHKEALNTRDSMGELATSSHLRSTLTMLKSDIAFKDLLNKGYVFPSR